LERKLALIVDVVVFDALAFAMVGWLLLLPALLPEPVVLLDVIALAAVAAMPVLLGLRPCWAALTAVNPCVLSMHNTALYNKVVLR
jgi:hypothetical protein